MQRSRWAALNQIKEALLDIFGRGVFMVHYEDKSSSDDRPNCRSYDALPPAPDAILPVWSPPPAWCLKFAESSCLSLDRVGALHLNSLTRTDTLITSIRDLQRRCIDCAGGRFAACGPNDRPLSDPYVVRESSKLIGSFWTKAIASLI